MLRLSLPCAALLVACGDGANDDAKGAKSAVDHCEPLPASISVQLEQTEGNCPDYWQQTLGLNTAGGGNTRADCDEEIETDECNWNEWIGCLTLLHSEPDAEGHTSRIYMDRTIELHDRAGTAVLKLINSDTDELICESHYTATRMY